MTTESVISVTKSTLFSHISCVELQNTSYLQWARVYEWNYFFKRFFKTMIKTFSCNGLQATGVKILKWISWTKTSRSCFSFPGKTFLKLCFYLTCSFLKQFSWPSKQPHSIYFVVEKAYYINCLLIIYFELSTILEKVYSM